MFTVEKRKQAPQKAPFLGYPDDTNPYTLTRDASLFGIGAIVSQRQQWGETIIAYASKTIIKSQQNHSATKQELFAMVYFTEHFRNCLLGQKFLIITNHSGLTWLYRTRRIIGQMDRKSWTVWLWNQRQSWKEDSSRLLSVVSQQSEEEVNYCSELNQVNTKRTRNSLEQLFEHQKSSWTYCTEKLDWEREAHSKEKRGRSLQCTVETLVWY